MELGIWRDITFEVAYGARMKILTFANMQMGAQAKWATHGNHSGLERIEKTGTKLQAMRFEMLLRADAGINPWEVREKLDRYLEDGKGDYFLLGSRMIGTRHWVLQSYDFKVGMVRPGGEILSATANVSLSQYY